MRGSTITGLFLSGVVALAGGIAYATKHPKKDPAKSYFIYRVKSGDTASALGLRFFGDAKKWTALLLEGSSKTPSLAEELSIGASLRVPCRWYTVSSGDTLAKIAASTLGDAGRWKRIFEANRAELPDPNKLEVGSVLAVPDANVGGDSEKPVSASSSNIVSVGCRPFDLLGAVRVPRRSSP